MNKYREILEILLDWEIWYFKDKLFPRLIYKFNAITDQCIFKTWINNLKIYLQGEHLFTTSSNQGCLEEVEFRGPYE
jgi:hypothetical protein